MMRDDAAPAGLACPQCGRRLVREERIADGSVEWACLWDGTRRYSWRGQWCAPAAEAPGYRGHRGEGLAR